MKKQNIILFLFLLVGLSILNYPFLSQWVNRRSESQAVESYEKQIDVLEEEKKRAIKQEAEAYNKELLEKQTGVSDGFSVKSKRDDRYERILNTSGDGIMGVLRIPKIQVHLPIYHGTSAKVLEEGVGHLYGSSFPTGGEGTHSVFSSHRGLPSKTLFTDLDQLKEGDLFFLDIEMGKMDGMQTAREIRQMDENLALVFVTGYSDYVFDGYQVGALDYLMKPVKEEKLRSVLQRLSERMIVSAPQYYSFQNTQGTFRILKKDILYFYSDRRQVILVTKEKEYPFYAKLDEVQQSVGKGFVRIWFMPNRLILFRQTM